MPSNDLRSLLPAPLQPETGAVDSFILPWRDSWESEIGRWIVRAVVFLLWLSVILLLRDQLFGAVGHAPPPLSLLLFGLLTAILAFLGHGTLMREEARIDRPSRSRALRHLGIFLPLLLAVVLEILVNRWISLFFVIPVVLIEGVAGIVFFGRVNKTFFFLKRSASGNETVPEVPPPLDAQELASTLSAEREAMLGGNGLSDLEMESEEGPDLFGQDDNVLQQLTRSRVSDEIEHIDGCLRASFAPGQKALTLHVAFCPPFARVPEIQAEQLEGPECRIKLVQCQPYGARFDLKLVQETSEDDGRVQIIFFAEGPVLSDGV